MHRTASVCEISGRFSLLKDEVYIPSVDNVRLQSQVNKQGSDGIADQEVADNFVFATADMSEAMFEVYNNHIQNGITREQARIGLPLNTYTSLIWKIDLHNLLHFLDLRCDSHAQQETRVYANTILELIKPIVPVTIEAWEDYSEFRGAVRLTRLEIEALRKIFPSYEQFVDINSDNNREKQEWKDKFNRIMG